MKHMLLIGICICFLFPSAIAQKKAPQSIYEIKLYSFHSEEQEAQLDTYLKDALLPALHRAGMPQVGVFKPLSNDTAAVKKIYTITPYLSLEAWSDHTQKIYADKKYQQDATNYLNAPNKSGVYDRQETILLRAFKGAPVLTPPTLTGSKEKRIYELRSYESSTEKQARNKIHMFDEGGEMKIFKHLNFNAVFYGSVIAGSHMPNLMYMTTHADSAAQKQNWRNFGGDDAWNKLRKLPEYQENVSHIDALFLRATPYSDY